MMQSVLLLSFSFFFYLIIYNETNNKSRKVPKKHKLLSQNQHLKTNLDAGKLEFFTIFFDILETKPLIEENNWQIN